MIYKPKFDPDRIDKILKEIHSEIDEITDEGFDGVTAKNGLVLNLTGDLDNDDIGNIEDYLGVPIVKIEE